MGFPPQCLITRIVVRQVGGVLSDFTLDLFSALRACTHSESSGPDDPDNPDTQTDAETFRVLPTLTSSAPGELYATYDAGEVAFVNMDVRSWANKKQRIYLEIEPEGSGDMTFDVALTCLQGY